MSKRGDVIENPVTGEHMIVRVGTEETNGQLLVVDGYFRPGAAVAGEHVHPAIDERFTVVRGRVGFRLDGRESIVEPGQHVQVPPGVVHDWWNAGDTEAYVQVEIRPGARFEEMARNLFGLAQDGKTNAKGMPSFLQLVALATEFEDVLSFTHPPRSIQRVLFGVLAPVARLLGYRGSDPKYLKRQLARVPVEPWPGPMQQADVAFLHHTEQPT